MSALATTRQQGLTLLSKFLPNVASFISLTVNEWYDTDSSDNAYTVDMN
jgi:hypothetical protein